MNNEEESVFFYLNAHPAGQKYTNDNVQRLLSVVSVVYGTYGNFSLFSDRDLFAK